ncbi:hypothetical protein [Xanthomonas campestris]|uniref:hypothetical protein n=1 Tax=Xanthomonas campestris TaxID=339 RepID=UPI0020CA0D9C|nr:hypothetical protein [Xanthomonas campestris]MEA9920799.1 hypothetical protein [Xanthomonas campestris pv. raphani]
MNVQSYAAWWLGAAVAVGLTACGGEKEPSKEDAVKAVEAFYTQQGREVLLQRNWQFAVKNSDGLKLDCDKKPNGDQACNVTGKVIAAGSMGGQTTEAGDKPMDLKFNMTFRPHGEGWEPVEVKDEGTSAG